MFLSNFMEINDIKIIKSDDRGVIYDCGKSNFISRKQGTISADHTHNEKEELYLVKGEVEITINDETKTIKAPVLINIPANAYHKLVALSDIDLVIDRSLV